MAEPSRNDSSIVKHEEGNVLDPQRDEFRFQLQIFQFGVQNLENGTKLLKGILKLTMQEKFLSLISLKLSEKTRLNRLLALDLESTQRKLLEKSEETLNALDKIIKSLDDRYGKSSDKSIQVTSELQKHLILIEELKKEENEIKKHIEALTSSEGTLGKIEKVGETKRFLELRKTLQDNSLKQEKCKAQIKTSESYSKSEATHATYSYNMLKKLLPIQEMVSANKEILYNRIEMLNRMVAAGTILKPLGELSEELGNVGMQFSEANAQLNNIMGEVEIVY